MKIKSLREPLNAALSKVGGIIERRQTIPILSNLLMILADSRLEIVGTDLEIEVRTSLEVSGEGEGEFTISARKLMDICRSLPDGAEIVIDVEDGRASVRSGRGRFVLGTLPAQDYPATEGYFAEQQLTLPSRVLRNLLRKSAFAMAQQDVRYYLNGLLLEIKEGSLNAVATDGHRLAKASIAVNFPSEDALQVIVPRKTVLELLRQLSDSDQPVQLEMASKFARVNFGDTVIVSKVIDGRYPDYERVIPRGEGVSAIVDREDMRKALSRTAILSNEKYKGVRLGFGEGVLRLQAHNPEQEEATEELNIKYAGEPRDIGFNVDYLLDVLGVVDDSAVELSIIETNGSIRVDEQGEQDSTFVVMPMRI